MNNICPLPWNHLSVEPNGLVYSCCHTAEENPLGNLKKNSLNEIFQGKKNRDIREQFLENQTPEQCRICIDAEKWGQISLRQSAQKMYQVEKGDEGKIRFLSLRLNNTCNLSCRICNATLSTAWISDAKKLGKPVPEKPVSAFENQEAFEKFLDNFPELEILYFAGGEPFLTPWFYQILDTLIERKQTNLHLMINTNFSVDGLGQKNVFETLSHFQRVSLDLSLDGMGELSDYMREGSSWIDIEKRIEKVQTNYPEIELFINPTISVMNIFQLPQFIETLMEKGFGPMDIRINPLLRPDHLNIKNLNDKNKDLATSKIKVFSKKLLSRYDLSTVAPLITQLDGLSKMMNESRDEVARETFFQEMSQLDELRKRDSKKVMPEIFS